MAVVIGVVSQKGGVGKSTIARLIGREYANNGWSVKIADMDISQGTSKRWHERRLQFGIEPEIAVEQFSRVDRALKHVDSYDLLIFDGAPHATAMTLSIAKVSDLVILPTGIALDDLEPTVKLARELKAKRISISKIAVVFCGVGNSDREIEEATDYIDDAGFHLIDGAIPNRVGYRRASDMGRAPTETAHPSLNEKADKVVQGVVNRLEEPDKE